MPTLRAAATNIWNLLPPDMVDSITDWMDISVRKFQELVMDKEVWQAAEYGVAKSRTQLSDWTELNLLNLQIQPQAR